MNAQDDVPRRQPLLHVSPLLTHLSATISQLITFPIFSGFKFAEMEISLYTLFALPTVPTDTHYRTNHRVAHVASACRAADRTKCPRAREGNTVEARGVSYPCRQASRWGWRDAAGAAERTTGEGRGFCVVGYETFKIWLPYHLLVYYTLLIILSNL